MTMQAIDKTTKLVKINNPFDMRDREEVVIDVRDGYTIREAISDNFPEGLELVICLNGKEVENLDTQIRSCDCLVMSPRVEGNEGWGMVAMIGLSILAIYTGGLAAGALELVTEGGALTTGGMIAASAVSASIMIGGGLLIQSLLPPPSARTASSSNNQAYGWNPRTTQQAGIKWPVYYGENKVYGNVILSMTEPVSDTRKQRYNLVLALAEGPIDSIGWKETGEDGIERLRGVYINNQAIDDYEEVEYDLRKGYTRQPVMDGFAYNGSQEAMQQLVESDSPYVFSHIYDENYDSFQVDCGHPAGLYKFNSDGSIGWFYVAAKCEYKKISDSVWKCIEPTNRAFPIYAFNIVSGKLRVLIDIYSIDVTKGLSSPEKQENKFFASSDTGVQYIPASLKISNLPIEIQALTNHEPDTEIVATKLISTGQNPRDPEPYRWWMGDRYRWVELNVSVSGIIPDQYKVTTAQKSVIHAHLRDMAHLYADNITSSHKFSFGTADYDKTAENGTEYQIKITKITQEKKDKNGNKLTKYGQDMYCLGIRDLIKFNHSYPRLAMIGIKSLATEDLSGSLEFECVIKGKSVRVYNSETQSWTVKYSNNPAWVLYDIMTQPVYGNSEGADFVVARYDGLQPEYIDLDSIVELADYCDEILSDGNPRHTFNGGFTDEKTLHDQILEVCQQCRAIYVWNGARAYVVIDKPADYKQVFSMSNIEAYSFTEEFIQEDQRATAIEVQFIDKQQDYKRTSYIVTNNTSENNSNRVSMFFPGINNSREAWRAGKYRLKRNQELRRVISFKTGLNAINCIIGDIFLFQHDVPDWGKSCRVASATANTITLAQDLAVDPEKEWSIIVRPNNQAEGANGKYYDRIISKPVYSIEGRTITVTEPFTEPVQNGDLVVMVENVPKLFKVTYLRATQDQKVEVHAIEYKESIYDVDGENPSDLPEVVNPKPVSLQPVNNIQVSESYITGSNYVTLSIVWENPDTLYIYKGVEIYAQVVDGPASWAFLGMSNDNRFVWDKALPNTKYMIKLVSTGYNGESYPFAKAPYVIHSTSDQNTTVPNYSGIRVSGLCLTNFPNQDVFATRNAQFTWNKPATSISDDGTASVSGFAGYSIIIENTDGTIRRKVAIGDNHYTYTYENNYEDGNGTPARSFVFKVAAVDVNAYMTNYSQLTVNNPVPAAITGLTAVGTVKRIDLNWDAGKDSDISGYIVWGSAVNGFAPGEANRLYKGPNNSLSLVSTERMFFKVAAYDNFGDTGLNVSGQVEATPLSSTSEITDYDLDYVNTTGFVISIASGNVLTIPAGKKVTFRKKAYTTAGVTVNLTDTTKRYYVNYDFESYLTDGNTLTLNVSIIQPGVSYFKFLFGIAEYINDAWQFSQMAIPQRMASFAFMQVGTLTSEHLGSRIIKTEHFDGDCVYTRNIIVGDIGLNENGNYESGSGLYADKTGKVVIGGNVEISGLPDPKNTISQLTIYCRSASVPTLPAYSTVGTDGVIAIGSNDNGWSAVYPSGPYPLYLATASMRLPDSGSVPVTWSGPVRMSGEDGNIGWTNLTIYCRSETTPALPDSSMIDSGGFLSVNDDNWHKNPPALTVETVNDDYYCYPYLLRSVCWDRWQVLSRFSSPYRIGRIDDDHVVMALFLESPVRPDLPDFIVRRDLSVFPADNSLWSVVQPVNAANPVWMAVLPAVSIDYLNTNDSQTVSAQSLIQISGLESEISLTNPVALGTPSGIAIGSVAEFQAYFGDHLQTALTSTQISNHTKSFYLTADLDFSDIEYTRAPIAWCTCRDAGVYHNTDYALASGTPFRGSFNGNGFKIKNLRIVSPDSSCQNYGDYHMAFIGWHESGTIKNLGLENVYVEGNYHSAALVGRLLSGTISNCYATGHVSGTPNLYYQVDGIGGLVGTMGNGWGDSSYISCAVVDSYFVGTVSVSRITSYGQYIENIGGLVGFGKGRINNCRSGVNLAQIGMQAAGSVPGYISGQGVIVDGANVQFIGGLCGQYYSPNTYSQTQSVWKCRSYMPVKVNASGNMTDSSYSADIGGFMGYIGNGFICHCVSRGNVSSGHFYDPGNGNCSLDYAAGFIGRILNNAAVHDSYAACDISCRANYTEYYSATYAKIAGFTAYSTGYIQRCYYSGLVSHSAAVNLFCYQFGSGYNSRISNCFCNAGEWDPINSGGGTVLIWGDTAGPASYTDTFTAVGWNFNSVWVIAQDQPRPVLRWEGYTTFDFYRTVFSESGSLPAYNYSYYITVDSTDWLPDNTVSILPIMSYQNDNGRLWLASCYMQIPLSGDMPVEWTGPVRLEAVNGTDGQIGLSGLSVRMFYIRHNSRESFPLLPALSDWRGWNPGQPAAYPAGPYLWLLAGYYNDLGEVVGWDNEPVCAQGVGANTVVSSFRYSDTVPDISALPVVIDLAALGWHDTPPDSGSGHLYMIRAEFNESGQAVSQSWTGPVRLTGENGKDGADTLLFKFADEPYPVGSSYWHTEYQADDIYMLLSYDAGVSWQGPVKITAEDGAGLLVQYATNSGGAGAHSTYTVGDRYMRQYLGTLSNPITGWFQFVASDGTGLEVLYNTTNSDTGAHSTYTAGDVWFKQRLSGGSWSAWIKFVGESLPAQYVDFRFQNNSSATTGPAVNKTSANPGAAWLDAPVNPSSGQYTWLITANFDSENVLNGQWSDPLRITGTQGPQGPAGSPGTNGIDGRTVVFVSAAGDIPASPTAGTLAVIIAEANITVASKTFETKKVYEYSAGQWIEKGRLRADVVWAGAIITDILHIGNNNGVGEIRIFGRNGTTVQDSFLEAGDLYEAIQISSNGTITVAGTSYQGGWAIGRKRYSSTVYKDVMLLGNSAKHYGVVGGEPYMNGQIVTTGNLYDNAVNEIIDVNEGTSVISLNTLPVLRTVDNTARAGSWLAMMNLSVKTNVSASYRFVLSYLTTSTATVSVGSYANAGLRFFRSDGVSYIDIYGVSSNLQIASNLLNKDLIELGRPGESYIIDKNMIHSIYVTKSGSYHRTRIRFLAKQGYSFDEIKFDNVTVTAQTHNNIIRSKINNDQVIIPDERSLPPIMDMQTVSDINRVIFSCWRQSTASSVDNIAGSLEYDYRLWKTKK